MPLTIHMIVLLAAATLFAQQPSPDQIQELQKRIAANPQLARQQIQSNPQLLNRLTPDQQAQVTAYIDSVERSRTSGRAAATPHSFRNADSLSTADSTGRIAGIDSLHDTAFHKQQEIETDSLTVFGRHLFTQKFLPPPYTDIPDDYVIAPGDEILLRFWGRYNQERTYLIGKDGYVFIEPLNRQAYLIGMTYGALKAMVQRVSTSSPGVEGDVRVVSAHPLYIHIAGNAQNPGTIHGPASYSFWQFLMLSKGPATNGSVRDIRVSRSGREIAKIDLYEFLMHGKKPIVALRNEDLIFFGQAQAIVRIGSLVKRPGLYELKQTERLGDLVTVAGGFPCTAFAPGISILRTVDINEKTSSTFPFKVMDIDLTKKGWEATPLRDGDIITARDMAPLAANDLYITGSGIAVPGTYSLPVTPWSAGNLIKEAGGLAPGAHRAAELLRLSPDGRRTSQPLDLFD
ncbi:MAG: SLBB domain-containing protein, partial [Chitinispirillaceae bacterium]|nr:SLBB domain-containing protein [Chitinispirillaceae bacterium]